MRVLIIGGRGLLGEWLAETYASFKPTVWDKNDIDITNEVKTRTNIISVAPDLIINAAAFTQVDLAEKQKKQAFAVNETGIKNIGRVANDINAKVVHYSTDYVFPGDSNFGYNENDPPGPAVNAYGESKLAGERALKETGANFYLIRTAWLYGPKPGSAHPNFVDTILQLAKARLADPELNISSPLLVVNDQCGCPTYAKDLAQATLTLCNNDYLPGIYHLVNAGTTSWYDYAVQVLKISNIDLEITPVSSAQFERLAKRPKFSILNNNIGPPLRPWRESLTEYLSNKE